MLSGSDPAGQHPGWPLTLSMHDNDGRAPGATLPLLRFEGYTRPVVQIIDEAGGVPVYTTRAPGATFRPPVYRAGTYTVRVGEPGVLDWQVRTGMKSTAEPSAEALIFRF